MRVLHIITGLNVGGAETALLNILKGGLAKRYDSAVLSLQTTGTIGPYIQELGIPVYTLGMNASLPTPQVISRLFRLARFFRPNLIQGWMYHGNLAATLTAHLAHGRPMVGWNIRHSLYNIDVEKMMTRHVIRVNRILSGTPNAIIYNSHLSRRQHESFGFQDSRAQVIPNGFDLERLKPDSTSGSLVRHEFDLPDDALLIGHIARFHPMKDHATFLRAAVHVAHENPVAYFLVVGRDVSPANPDLTGIVPPDLLSRFIFTGERNDVHRLMQAMDILCLSSWSEAFPNVLGEAMACAVPCVATDVGDSANIIQKTGFVVPPSDPDLLANALTEMTQKDPAERHELGQAAKARIANCYSLSSIVTQYTDLYEGL